MVYNQSVAFFPCRTWFWIWSLSQDLRGSPSAWGMIEAWPHHGDMISVVCLVSENHPKHGQKSYKIIIEDDLGLLGGLGVKNKSSVGSGLANSSFAFLSEILGSEKSSLVCHLWRAYHATSLCLVCLSDVRCTSSAAIAPGQMDMFFGDQTGIDIPRKCMFFFRVFFFQMFVSLLCPWWRQQGLKITTRMRRWRLMCMSTFIRSLTRSHAVLLGQPRLWIRLNIAGWRDHASNGVNHLQLETTARLTTRCVRAKICVPSPESLKLSKPLISCERFRLHLPVGHPRFRSSIVPVGCSTHLSRDAAKKLGVIPRERWPIPIPIDDRPIPPTACWCCKTNIPFWLN